MFLRAVLSERSLRNLATKNEKLAKNDRVHKIKWIQYSGRIYEKTKIALQ